MKAQIENWIVLVFGFYPLMNDATKLVASGSGAVNIGNIPLRTYELQYWDKATIPLECFFPISF